MSASTFAEWVTDIQAMTVTGVTRYYDYPPRSIDTADLPVLIVDSHQGSGDTRASGCPNMQRGYVTTIALVLQPVNQQLAATTFTSLETAATNLLNAFTTLTACNFRSIDWETTTYTVAGTDYRAIVATIAGDNSP